MDMGFEAIKKQTPFALYDFPDETLLLIMMNYNSKDLMTMANVCTRFRSIAKDAFGRKYCGTDNFELHCDDDEDLAQTQYEPYFSIFGENMSAIHISACNREIVGRNHWLMVQIQNYCKSITHLYIYQGIIDLTLFLRCMPKLAHLHLSFVRLINESWTTQNYAQLIHFDACDLNCTDEGWIGFIHKNSQLEILELSSQEYSHLTNLILSGKLPQLKNLRLHYWGPYYSENYFDPMPNNMELKNLETFGLTNNNVESCMNILKAMTQCKKIAAIDVKCWNWNDDIIVVLDQYKRLESIDIQVKALKLNHLNRMVEQLPHSTQIKLRCVSDFINVGQTISHIIQCCTKLEVLSIGVPKLPELKHSFIYEMAEATQHNPKMKMKLFKVNCSLEKALTAYRGTVRRGYAILYWNGYDHIHSKTSMGLLDLNEKCTQKIIQLISTSFKDLAALFNTCKRAQQAVKDYLSENAVRASIVPAALDKNVLECLGEHILRAELSRGCDLPLQSQNDFDDDYMDELYNEACKFRQDLNRYCFNLTELTVDVFDDDDLLDEFDHPWPNLTKIKLSYCYDDGYQNLQQFTSPKLAYNAVL